MNQCIVWLPPASRLAAILSGGKAPAVWKRDIARKTTGLASIWRSTAWVEEFGVTYPKLCVGPLLGHTLTALTRLSDSTEGAQPRTIQREKAKFAGRENLLESKQDKVQVRNRLDPRIRDRAPIKTAAAKGAASDALTSGSAHELFLLKAQADHLVLSRLAGDWSGSERMNHGRVQPSTPTEKRETVFHGIKPARTPLFSAQGEKNHMFSPFADGDLGAQHDWSINLARRASRALVRKIFEPAQMKAIKDDVQTSGQAPSLTEQLSVPLDGISAPLDLLQRLTSQEAAARVVGSRESERRQPSLGQPLSGKKPAGLWRPSKDTVPREGWRNNLDGANNFDGGTKLENIAPARTMSLPESPAEPAWFGKTEHESWVPPVSPTPNLAPSLPSLLPPQGIRLRPLPVAAATARQGAWEEAAVATDDLGALADKIQLILDEQARRHGIDV